MPLSRAKIAATAIRLADAHGLDGLSVRKIAKELGVGPMRLYDYVINRSELLDLMVDAVYAQIAEAGQHSEWRATVLAIAHATRDAALDHEWFADLLGGRPHLGPHALAVGESTAAALSQAPGVRGIDDLQRALGALNAFIIGALRREITERRTARSTGTDVAAWQASPRPLPDPHARNRPLPHRRPARHRRRPPQRRGNLPPQPDHRPGRHHQPTPHVTRACG